MRAKNTGLAPLDVYGRMVPVGDVIEVDDSDPVVAELLSYQLLTPLQVGAPAKAKEH